MNQAELQELYREVREDWNQAAFEALCKHVIPLLRKHIESQPPGTFGHSRDPEGPVAEVLKELADAFKDKQTDNHYFKPDDFDKFLAHLKRMAMRRANDSFKGHEARGLESPAPLCRIPAARPGPATEVAELDRAKVMRTVQEELHAEGKLSDKQVEALKMKMSQDMTLQSIADSLGSSKDQVRILLDNAYKTIFPELKRRLDLNSKGRPR